MFQPRGTFTALVTPFSADGSSVDVERLERNIEAQSIAGVTGIVPCGTTGETPTLSDDEYRLVVEMGIRCGHEQELLVMPGAGSNSTHHALELHRFCKASGADAALHVTPYYNKPSQEGLYRHFMALADSCDLPIMLYNIPGRTGVLMTLETIERLAAHPNIVAIKDATGGVDLAAQLAVRSSIAVFSGDDPLTLPFASVGAVGVVSVLSNLVPDRVASLCRAFLGGDWELARSIHEEILPMGKALLSLDVNPVPIKAALAQLGRDTGAVRLPLCEMKPDAVAKLREILAANDLVPAAVA